MSAEATGDAWRASPYSGDVLLVHLAIADVVNDLHDNRFWMSRAALSEKARTSLATVDRARARMVEDGWLGVLSPGGGRGKPTEYRYHLGGKPPQGAPVSETSSPESNTSSNGPSYPLPIPRTQERARPRNPIFDALVALFGDASTDTRASFYGKIAAELKRAGATPEQIESRGARLLGKGWADAGPGALVKHWDELARARRPDPGGLNAGRE